MVAYHTPTQEQPSLPGNEIAIPDHPVWEVYNGLRTAHLNVLYYSRLLERVTWRNNASEWIIAIAAPSSTVVGFGCWETVIGRWVWLALSSIAALAAAAKPIFRWSQLVRDLESWVKASQLLEFSLESVRLEIRRTNGYSHDLQERFLATREDLRRLITGAKVIKEDFELRKRCTADTMKELRFEDFFVPKD